jgi:hypothetical protein
MVSLGSYAVFQSYMSRMQYICAAPLLSAFDAGCGQHHPEARYKLMTDGKL